MYVGIAKIVFQLLDGGYDPIGYDDPYTSLLSKDPHYIYNGIIKASDKYDIPQILPRLSEMLWHLATANKESAVFVFAIAFKKQDRAVAKVAIRNFQDLCHPLLFSYDTVHEVGYRAWYLLVRTVPNRTSDVIDWRAVSSSVVFHARSVILLYATSFTFDLK